MINIIYSNAITKDFEKLNSLLDKDYYMSFGEIALKYRQYNTLIEISDFFITYYNNAPVACGCIKKFSDDTAELKRIFVLQEYRRMNIATDMVNRCERLAKEKGFKFVTLETGVEMLEAIALYKKLGYELIDNYGDFAGDNVCCCMKKEL